MYNESRPLNLSFDLNVYNQEMFIVIKIYLEVKSCSAYPVSQNHGDDSFLQSKSYYHYFRFSVMTRDPP